MRQEGQKKYFIYKVFDANNEFWKFAPAEEEWAERHKEYIRIPEKLYLQFGEASLEAIRLNDEVLKAERRKGIKKV